MTSSYAPQAIQGRQVFRESGRAGALSAQSRLLTVTEAVDRVSYAIRAWPDGANPAHEFALALCWASAVRKCRDFPTLRQL